MSLKRYTGSAWVDVESVKRYGGSAWVDCESVKRYDGSAWVEVWPVGIKLSTLAVGTKIRTSISGTDYDWLLVQQGLPSSSYHSSCNGTWLLLEKLYVSRAMWGGSGYGDSGLNTYLNDTFYNLLPAGMKTQIQNVTIPCQQNWGSTTVSTATTKVFLLSSTEIGGVGGGVIVGSKLTYFPDNSSNEPKRIAYLDGTATKWWTRTTTADDGIYSGCQVSENGSAYGSASQISGNSGVRPAVILPGAALAEMEPNADGSYNLKV